MLKDQLQEVEKRIQAACDRAGRKREEVTLIAVSKTKPVETLQEAYDLGVRIFGENKVQELTAKYEALPKDIHWHMIGHMQRNKVKYIIDKVDLIHSVDSVRLAETIDKEAEKHNVTANILIEVNVAKEESKFGLMPEEAGKPAGLFLRLCGRLFQLHLMRCIPKIKIPDLHTEHSGFFPCFLQSYADTLCQILQHFFCFFIGDCIFRQCR